MHGFRPMDQVAHFQRRLAETIGWCASQDWIANPAEGLRSPQLRLPEITDDGRAIFEARLPREETARLLAIEHAETLRQWQQHVEQLAMKRAALLHTQDTSFLQPLQLRPSGRLLAFDPQGTLSDGAATAATQGFFDDDNVPPWDTWIWYVINDLVSNLPWWQGCDSYLLSWVPNALVAVVEVGIDSNPEECIRWATDLDTAFIWQLKQAGFIL
jgi:hypothetical protein